MLFFINNCTGSYRFFLGVLRHAARLGVTRFNNPYIYGILGNNTANTGLTWGCFLRDGTSGFGLCFSMVGDRFSAYRNTVMVGETELLNG